MAEEKSQPYDLKASAKKISQLLPVIKAADGSIVDGTNRNKADPEWFSVTNPKLDTVDKIAIAKIALNVQRRDASRPEKQNWLNTIATEFTKKDPTLSGERLALILSAETGMSLRWVYEYLPDKWKGEQGPKGPKIAPLAKSYDHAVAHARARTSLSHLETPSPQPHWTWTETIKSLKVRCENIADTDNGDETLLLKPDEVDAVLMMTDKYLAT